MEKRRDIRVGIEYFVEVSLAIVVEIMQAHDAIATSHVNCAVHNQRAEMARITNPDAKRDHVAFSRE